MLVSVDIDPAIGLVKPPLCTAPRIPLISAIYLYPQNTSGLPLAMLEPHEIESPTLPTGIPFTSTVGLPCEVIPS